MQFWYKYGFLIAVQVLFFLVTIGLIFWFVKSTKNDSQSAKEILDKRLAQGKINAKEYTFLIKKIKE